MKAADYITKYGRLAEVYSHVAPDGTNIHVAIEALRDQIRTAQMRPELVPLDPAVFHRVKTTIAPALLEDMLVQALKPGFKRHPVREPVIFAIDRRGVHQLIDGAHRYVFATMLQSKRIPAFLCWPALWEQFVLTGLPSVTADELRRAPHPREVQQKDRGPWYQPE